MPAFATGQLNNGFLCDVNGNVTTPANATIILSPPPRGGALAWGTVWLSLGCDFGTAYIRVAVHNGGSWGPIETVVVVDTEPRLLVLELPPGTGKVSMGRVPTSATDTDDSLPVAWLLEAGA